MNQEKRWKRGDIGPDGRVFWSYDKTYKNGERWITKDKYNQKREKNTERHRRYKEKGGEKNAERDRRYKERNREILLERGRLYREQNREKLAEAKRRRLLKKSFSKHNVSSYEEWVRSVDRAWNIAAAIFALQPNPGQTLAQLIHELSGYSMEVCEQIANPPVPDLHDEPAPQTAAQPEPPREFNPDHSPF